MRSLVASAVALAASLLSFAASANEGGLAGYTGKPNAAAPQGESCNQCHSGGTAPQVTITGPATLAAGQVADYSLVVTTGQTRAAGAVAATDGVVLTPLAGFRDSFGEMVQNAPLAPSGGQATFKFRVTAPLTGNTLRLWAVGLAANGGGTGGDRATQTTKDITVTGGAPPPPPPPPGSDAGASGSSSGGSSSSGAPPPGTGGDGGSSGSGTKPGTTSSGGPDGTNDDASDNDDGPGGSPKRSSPNGGTAAEGPACSARPLVGSSEMVLPGILVIGLAACARRRRRTELD